MRKNLFPLGDDIGFAPGHGHVSMCGWKQKTKLVRV